MMSFRGGRLREFVIPDEIARLIKDIDEGNGRLRTFAKEAPHVHEAMRQRALGQSAESSSRIANVTVAPERLNPLVFRNVPPAGRFEEEVQGYRRAFSLIYTSAPYLPLTPDNIRKIHKILQAGSPEAGEWKRVHGEVTQIRPRQTGIREFRPVPPDKAPGAVEELCECFRHAISHEKAAPIPASACLVLDFLCIHPFLEGNGRVARLLTLLALNQNGMEIGGCISLERLIEETREDYYENLKLSSRDWHEGRHDIEPWLRYFTTIVWRAYRQFDDLTRPGE